MIWLVWFIKNESYERLICHTYGRELFEVNIFMNYWCTHRLLVTQHNTEEIICTDDFLGTLKVYTHTREWKMRGLLMGLLRYFNTVHSVTIINFTNRFTMGGKKWWKKSFFSEIFLLEKNIFLNSPDNERTRNSIRNYFYKAKVNFFHWAVLNLIKKLTEYILWDHTTDRKT